MTSQRLVAEFEQRFIRESGVTHVSVNRDTHVLQITASLTPAAFRRLAAAYASLVNKLARFRSRGNAH